MRLEDIRDYLESLGLAESVYMGKMDHKEEKSLGVYNSKHTHEYRVPLGGSALASYELKYVTILIHWTQSPRETEKAAEEIYKAVSTARNIEVNQKTIQFVQPLYDLQDVGTDENGIYEMVIEAAFVCKKGE